MDTTCLTRGLDAGRPARRHNRASRPRLLALVALCLAPLAACPEPDPAPPVEAPDAGGGPEPAADAGSPDVPTYEEIPVELPPGTEFCAPGNCAAPVVARLCPDTSRACGLDRSARVSWAVDGKPFNRVALLVSPVEEGQALQITSGAAWSYWRFLMVSDARELTLESGGSDLTLLNYAVPVPWGSSLQLSWMGTGRRSALGSSFLFRFSSFEIDATPDSTHALLDAIATEEAALADVGEAPYRAFAMPTELALPLGGEGNWSFGNGVVTLNYGNPEHLQTVGGATRLIAWEFAHEYAHELFTRAAPKFTGATSCLNEGLADAMGNHFGHIPDSDFCPAPDGRCVWEAGCAAVTGDHARGNCLLWQFKRTGRMTATFLRGIYHPTRTWAFDSCAFASERTGNSYVVLFSEALGEDAAAEVTAAGIPNAGSLAAAKAALGL